MGMSVRVTRRCLAALTGLASACVWVPNAWAQTSAGSSAPAAAIVAEDASVDDQDGAQASKPAARWQLRRGVPVHTQLQGWAQGSDWTLTWQPRVSWLVAADVAFDGSFEEALKAVIEGLFFEGKPVRLVLWQGNRLAEVVSSDAR